MNKKITSVIANLERQRDEQIKEATEQIARTEEDLALTVKQLEEAYLSGDAEKGQKLMANRETLEKRKSFLEESLTKRKHHPSITREKADELRSLVNDDLTGTAADDKKKLEALIKEIKAIADNGAKETDEARQNGEVIVRLLKDTSYTASPDGRIIGFYGFVKRIVSEYETRIKPSMETMFPEE